MRTNELIRIQKVFAIAEMRKIEFVIAVPVAGEMEQCHVGKCNNAIKYYLVFPSLFFPCLYNAVFMDITTIIFLWLEQKSIA